MRYSEKIDTILKSELTNLINTVRQKASAFEPGTVEHYYEIYKETLEKQTFLKKVYFGKNFNKINN